MKLTTMVLITERGEKMAHRDPRAENDDNTEVWVEFNLRAPRGEVQMEAAYMQYCALKLPLAHPMAHLPIGKRLVVTIETV
jgi:hypothetical protein